MTKLKNRLAGKLRQSGSRVEKLDSDTILMRQVPTNPDFTKERTNVLVKRPDQGMPFLVFVDDDLDYTGPDGLVARAFRFGSVQQGWRAIFISSANDAGEAAEQALAAVGFDGESPRLPGPAVPGSGGIGDGLLKAYARDSAANVNGADSGITVGRADEIEEVASTLMTWRNRLALVVGKGGVGKTNLLNAVARKLGRCRPAVSLITLDLGVLLAGTLFPAERENVLRAVLKDAKQTGSAVVFEHLGLLHSETTYGLFLTEQALEDGVRLAGTALPEEHRALARREFAHRLQVIELAEPGPEETVEILRGTLGRMSEFHGVEIDEKTVVLAVQLARGMNGCFPAKAINLVDSAAALARLAGASVVGPDDICHAARSRGGE